jgi:tetratricopeptide (TPR) repeat protein
MACLIEGFKNDIFISYRQNDNKYDGWVTAFVHNLILELEATIKEKVTVYFDINPTDGLLETHSVDKSLEAKLKCLIFIPIISRTYCDKNSFAWQHEFCAFNRLAMGDKFGRDIRLTRGNFASRILPVKIHELDDEDKMLVENELGGSLRSIDFIYKSAGVNRPLRANEDHPHDNINYTYYRDQINKVANAVSEILTALKCESGLETEAEAEAEVTVIDEPLKGISRDERKALLKRRSFSNSRKFWVVAFWVIALLAIILKLMYPIVFKKTTIKEQRLARERISIAVLPFHNLTNDSTLNYLRLGIQEGVVTDLAFYPEDFNVRSFDLIHNFLRGENIYEFSSITAYSGSRISKKLDADVFILGDIYKAGDILYINAQLIDSKSEEIIKPFKIGGVSEKIMEVIESLSKMIRDYLLVSKIQKETYQANSENQYKIHYLTSSPEAYRCHILAMEAFYSFDYNTSIKLDSQAVVIDSNFIAAIVTLCWANFSNGKYEYAKKWLLKAYEKKDQIPLIQQIVLDYQYASLFQTPNEQINYLKQIQEIEDNNPYYYLILAYTYVNLDRYDESIPEFEKAQEIYKKWGSEPNDLYYYHFLITAYYKTGQYKKMKDVLKKAEKYFIQSNTKSKTGDQYFKIAIIYSDAGLYDKAEVHFKKAISLEPVNQAMLNIYAYSLINNNLNVTEALELNDAALKMDSTNGILIDTKGWGLYKQHNYNEALKLLEKAYQIIPSFEIKAHIDSAREAISKQN